MKTKLIIALAFTGCKTDDDDPVTPAAPTYSVYSDSNSSYYINANTNATSATVTSGLETFMVTSYEDAATLTSDASSITATFTA